ncbi:MarR family winged helix-turn-helix transcriptional regulator [Alterisphingorhabdus coralli]|uniref:MarR family transcriptional regulator n=1 Tax=Alterisphingorhabdus coralli TaxID=3071408 RepID=A0AA97F913_9SPHN|nr:MarR family transcriptional regulator [Parasphingorhabdus sp. SCSIO 66989]WOE75267.1 MarR family transcriptional regulator [Parasphingorhabdus sp. SCSIO 66989]
MIIKIYAACIFMRMDKALENRIGAFALTVSDKVQQAITTRFDKAGETPAALTAIGAAPGLTISDLQPVLRLSQPGTVRLVDRLVADGLVEKRKGEDARQVLLYLTAKGKRLRRSLLDLRHQAIVQLTQGLDVAQRETLIGLLDQMMRDYPTCEMDKYQACRMCDQDACARCPIPAL